MRSGFEPIPKSALRMSARTEARGARRYRDTLSSALVLGLLASTTAGQTAVRDLPPTYGAGVYAFTTSITITPPQGVAAIGLEDRPPAGWAVSNISDGGALDAQTGKIKWGPFFGTFPASVSYDVAVPGSANGPGCFGGKVSFDGLDRSITGDACVYGPVPAMSEWGVLTLGLCVLIAGTLLLRRGAGCGVALGRCP